MVQKKAAIYCRVSTADQSCERQERDLRACAEKTDWQIAGVWKETASGAKDGRKQRQEILALAQARKVDIILVTELTRWGRSTIDLIHTLQELQSWGVSLIAQSGLQFDLGTSQGKLMATIMASLAEFESDLIRERVKSGIAAAKARGKKIGRQPGQRIKSDRLAPKVLSMVEERNSYRTIADKLRISKSTVTDIVKRHRLRLSAASASTLAASGKKTTTVTLWLRVENNNRYGRGRKRSLEAIESFVLSHYDVKTLSECQYEVIFTYEGDADLDKQIYEMLNECQHFADLYNCSIEGTDVVEKGTDRSW
ncbi:MAG: recombinase family protein [Candidatus Obscuribacterales bacterium]|nr:recombinase family protein [Candidatus Obscuribacterales bacterium]